MTPIICDNCGMVDVPTSHFGSRLCAEKRQIAEMQALGYAPIPYRRWTRAFKKNGVPVVHGPITIYRTGNWAPKWFVDGFKKARALESFRKLDFQEQVTLYVQLVTMKPGNRTAHA
jgi:hypothetical protein